MKRLRCAVGLAALVAAPARAADSIELCRGVAALVWSSVATAPLREQTPLKQLAEAAPRSVKVAESGGLGKPGQSVADALARDHAAPADLVRKLGELPPARALRFGTGPLWLLDRVDGTLGCHTTLAVAVPATGPAHEVALPTLGENADLCALSALTAVSIGGDPALWIEQSGAFSDAQARSTVTVAAVRPDGFAPPCTVTIDYAVAGHVAHAFCDGIDCVPLIRTAELLAMRLRNGETAETLGAGVVSPEVPEDAADYRRMAAVVAADTQPLELPTFGVSLDTPYTAFSDPVSFPLRLQDGRIYLARIGHGSFGWRMSPDTLLAVYRLRDDHPVPAASVYVAARPNGIAAVSVQAP
nr:hypothetical protein [uncultured Rhodopila sp.]